MASLILGTHAMGEATYTQNFDFAPVDWKGLDNGPTPQWGPYGWSNTNLTGGNPAGEAGGTFLRTNVRNYYADRALYGTINENMPFRSSGEIYVSAPNADNDVILGHFLAPPQGAVGDELNHAGILLREFSANEWRFMARIRGDGTNQKDGNVHVVANGNYRYEYVYDPTAKTVTASLFPIGGGAALFTSTTPSLDAGETFRADSFGWTGGFSGAGSGQNMQAATDANTYSTYMPKVTQNFNTSPADWVQLGSPAFGFSNTNNTGQESGAGEAGGNFPREAVRRAYADTTIQQLNQTVPFGASGEFFLGNLSTQFNLDGTGVPGTSPDTEMFIAHFRQDQVDGVKEGDQHAADQGGHSVVGMYILHDEPVDPGSAQSQLRMRTRIYTADSTRLDGDTVTIAMTDGTPTDPAGRFKFDYNWDPATMTLTARVLDEDGVTVLGTSSLAVPAGTEFDLDAFGLTNGFNGSTVPNRNFDLFLDQANYIVGAHWGANSDGVWESAANWNGPIPDGQDQIAYFGSTIGAPQTVTVTGGKTLGTMTFNSPQSYTVAGTDTITMGNPTLPDDGIADTTPPPYANLISSLQGSHTVSAPVALSGDTHINVAAGSRLTMSNLQSSSVHVSKGGAGTAAVNNVRAGSLSVEQGTLEVLQNATATGTSKVGALTIGTNAKLDLKDNKLITSSPVGNVSGTTYDGVSGEVQRANNGGAWNGPGGITTSLPAATTGLTSIGVGNAGQVLGISAGGTDTFGGQTVTDTDTLVMYTYRGDANLDGFISADDYTAIDFAVAQPGASGWTNGDFNWDGFISADDYTAIDFNLVAQGAPFPTGGSAGLSGVAAVPEPASLSLVGLAAAGLLSRRRRSRA